MNNIESKCTGCGACYNKCPKNAISMQYNDDGFLYPIINKELCVNCGLCQQACPIGKEVKEPIKQKFYAVWASDELRKKSSSGGMFSLLADYIFELKGVVVGCRYTEDFHYAYHTIAENKEELEPLRKSKYIQSEIRLVYREIEKILDEGRWVLFSGTPCQVAGLYSFLQKEYKKLITADIVCQGVSSLKAYHNFLEENIQGRDIEHVDFRDKSIEPWESVEFIKFKDGTYHYRDCNASMWYKAFLGGISTRKCCGDCKYANTNRQADFSLGDFWGISEVCSEIDFRNGVSLVLANSHRAHNFFKRVVKNAQYKEIDKTDVLRIAETKNRSLIHSPSKHYAYDRFFEILDKEEFTQAVKKVLYERYDIGIVGWWYNLNYGGTLTYYALHQVLREMGFSVLMIAKTSEDANYHPDKTSIPYRFALKHYYISKNHSKYKMNGLNEHCDIFISGSDQLFNPVLWQWSGPEYFLHFVNSKNKKIGYASSFGNEFRHIDNLTEKMAYWLKRFDAVSVREDYGVDIAQNIFGVSAKKVLDPVFICDKEEFIRLAQQSSVDKEKDFFVNFILDPDEEKREIIFYAKKKLKRKYINLVNADNIQENVDKLNMENTMANADVEDWLYYYINSDFVITDSFHGTCFAIIFHKPFISIANTKRGENRFVSLLKELGLMERLVYSFEEIKEKDYLFEQIDYSETDKIIEEKKEASLKWLYDAIVTPKNASQISDFQLLDNKIYELERQIEMLKNGKKI